MVFGPPIGKQLVCFIDDVGAPGANVLNSYHPLAIVRLGHLLSIMKSTHCLSNYLILCAKILMVNGAQI